MAFKVLMSFISVSHSPFSFSPFSFFPLADDSGSGDSGIDLTKHSAQIRQAAQKLVANYARISVLRVPQINIIHERNDGIMLNALILEKELSIRKSLSLSCSLIFFRTHILPDTFMSKHSGHFKFVLVIKLTNILVTLFQNSVIPETRIRWRRSKANLER